MGVIGKFVNRAPLKLAVYGQIALGATAILLLYLICLNCWEESGWLSVLARVAGFKFQVINYQSVVLTEALATTLVMAVLYTHIAALDKINTLKRLAE